LTNSSVFSFLGDELAIVVHLSFSRWYDLIERAAMLMQGLGVKPEVVHVNLGYWCVDNDQPDIEIIFRARKGGCPKLIFRGGINGADTYQLFVN
jgi:hypothetical protein